MKPLLIGIYSPAPRMGKTTAADLLIKHHEFSRVKFASPIHTMLSSLLLLAGYSHDTLQRIQEGDLKHARLDLLKGGPTYRKLAQTLGTEWGRDCIHGDLWADVWASAVMDLLEQGHNVVVDDLRFANELRVLLSLGGYPVELVRPQAVPPKRPWWRRGHRSEGQLSGKCLSYLHNEHGLDALHHEVGALVRRASISTSLKETKRGL